MVGLGEDGDGWGGKVVVWTIREKGGCRQGRGDEWMDE